MDEMFLEGQLEFSQTECAASIVFVLKEDGFICSFVNYWKLNAVTKRDLYHKPRISECIDLLWETAVL